MQSRSCVDQLFVAFGGTHALGVADVLGDTVTEAVSVRVGVRLTDVVLVADRLGERETEGDGDTVLVTEGDMVGEAEADGETGMHETVQVNVRIANAGPSSPL